eukprot:10155402-Lingulodinium_polyedra.AAC.1
MARVPIYRPIADGITSPNRCPTIARPSLDNRPSIARPSPAHRPKPNRYTNARCQQTHASR